MRGSKNPNPTPLEKARRGAGMSRNKLSELTGISPRVIERYEQGRTNINDAAVSKVYDLAKAIGVSIEEIMNK
jgi:transcriptional regulator with XRE-family HTH domain